MKRYRVAIVGLGRIGSTLDESIANACAASERLELVAGADILPDRRDAFGETWGIDGVYEDYREMIARESPDMSRSVRQPPDCPSLSKRRPTGTSGRTPTPKSRLTPPTPACPCSTSRRSSQAQQLPLTASWKRAGPTAPSSTPAFSCDSTTGSAS
ncbi:MAG: Gfo/Idh/MocA family oxidoreductase [Dehalococcoidia bacterium]|nr:Gfo/Idh/MocA family oxidoreductase [Dehalococcoidia bacterium]